MEAGETLSILRANASKFKWYTIHRGLRGLSESYFWLKQGLIEDIMELEELEAIIEEDELVGHRLELS